jgi:tape measure domain-containing protein
MAATLDARIRLDSSQFSGGLNRAMRETNAAVGRMSAQFGSLKNVLAGGLVGNFAVNMVGDIMDAAMQAEKLQAALSATTGSKSMGESQFKQIKQLAGDIGLGIQEAAKAMIQFQSAGMSSAQSMQTIKAGYNAILASGGGANEFSRFAVAIQQLRASPKPLQEELNQLREALPTTAKLMREAFGAQRAEDLQNLNISGRAFVDGFLASMERLPQVGDTMEKQIGRFKQLITDFKAELGKAAMPAAELGMGLISGLLQGTQVITDSATEALARALGYDVEGMRRRELAQQEENAAREEQKTKMSQIAAQKEKDAAQAEKDAASKDKSIAQGRTLAKVFGKFNDILKDTAKSARELAFSLEFEESMRAFEYQQRVNALVKELAEVEKEKRAERYNDFYGPTQWDDWVHPDEMKERERSDWQDRVRREGMNKSERRAQRDADREERNNIRKAADRKTREQMQEIKWNEQWNSFENAKNGKWLDQEATKRKLKDANRKEALQTIKGAWQTLTDIKDILNKLATA